MVKVFTISALMKSLISKSSIATELRKFTCDMKKIYPTFHLLICSLIHIFGDLFIKSTLKILEFFLLLHKSATKYVTWKAVLSLAIHTGLSLVENVPKPSTLVL